MPLNPQFFDHTLLRADATEEEIFSLCKQAKTYQFASVCVNGFWVRFCKHFLKDTNVKVCTTVGFPLGCTEKSVKVYETRQAVASGADEIDFVISLAAMKSENHEFVFDEMKAIVEAAQGRTTKAILEVALLTEDEIVRACELAVAAGCSFVKTSTGFSTSGATVESVRLMRRTVGTAAGVKASGGIKTPEQALAMVEAGANRLGTSATVAIFLGAAA
jgi:deoxyribose-phosphate aldolase